MLLSEWECSIPGDRRTLQYVTHFYWFLGLLIGLPLCSNISPFIRYRLYHVKDSSRPAKLFDAFYSLPSWIRRVWLRFPWHYCRCWKDINGIHLQIWKGVARRRRSHVQDDVDAFQDESRMKTKLEGCELAALTLTDRLRMSRQLKRSPSTEITLCSLPLKEGSDMHNWGLDHMLRSKFRPGWCCSDWLNFRRNAL